MTLYPYLGIVLGVTGNPRRGMRRPLIALPSAGHTMWRALPSMDDTMSEETEISTAEPKTGYDADIQALRDEITQMRADFTRTIEEYRTANSDLWARLQTAKQPDEPPVEAPGPSSEDVFNSIMRG